MKRCIMIVPNFKNIDIIEKIREKYDPTVKFVKPHITLVFPFESDILSEDIKEHTEKSIRGIKPFEVVLQGIESEKSFDNYIFLNVIEGTESIVELHKNLYTGLLKEYCPHWLGDTEFKPHMTIGNFKTKDECINTIEELKGIRDVFISRVDEITVSIIDENSNSIIEYVEVLK